jgi:hypothetical protein
MAHTRAMITPKSHVLEMTDERSLMVKKIAEKIN